MIRSIKKFKSEFIKLSKFLIVGGISAIVLFVSMWFFYEIIKLDYKISMFISYIFSVLCHYSANRRFTFKLSGNLIDGVIVRYILLLLLNLFITMAITIFVVEIMKISPIFAPVFTISVTVSISFLVSRFWVFKKSGN